MSFRVTQKTLESLEWPEVARRLRHECRTPQQQTGNSFSEFAEGLGEVRTRLSETSEARALLDGDHVAPLAGVADLQAALPTRREERNPDAATAARGALDSRGPARNEALPRSQQRARAAACRPGFRALGSQRPRTRHRLVDRPGWRSARRRIPRTRRRTTRKQPARERSAASPGPLPARPRHLVEPVRRLLHRAQRPLRAARPGGRQGLRARDRPRCLALGNHPLHRAGGRRRAEQQAEAGRAQRVPRGSPGVARPHLPGGRGGADVAGRPRDARPHRSCLRAGTPVSTDARGRTPRWSRTAYSAWCNCGTPCWTPRRRSPTTSTWEPTGTCW